MKRSVLRSLLASSVAALALLVVPSFALAIDFFAIPTPCSPGPNPPGGTCQPGGITVGPDSNIWFTEEHGNRIGRVNPGGSITEFPLSVAGAAPVEIVAAGGGLWFTQLGRNKIGTITPGGAIAEYPTSSSLEAPADGITVGPDGALWFTEFNSGTGTSRIGHMATSGALLHQFQLPGGSGPGDITVGPDNRLWFTQSSGRIGAIPYTSTATNGSDVSHYPSGGGLSDPGGITASGTGLWFTEASANRISRIEVTGSIGPPTPVGAGPSAIATGADGHLWFTEESAGKIGRITPSGVLTNEFPTSSPSAQPSGITAGPDGALWFTETVGNNIGRIATSTGGGGTLPPAPPPAPPAAQKTAKKCKVPKLRGLTIKKARKKLKRAGCKYRFRGKGKVRSTVPKAGRTTTKAVTVKLKRKKAQRR